MTHIKTGNKIIATEDKNDSTGDEEEEKVEYITLLVVSVCSITAIDDKLFLFSRMKMMRCED